VTPRPADREPQSHGDGQRRQITVLFCDLVGSTPLAGRLDPEDFRELLVRYLQLAQQAIERYSGYTAQFLGDGVVACFGYPRAHEDDAQRAVYAGLAILEGLDDVNAGLRARFGATLQVRMPHGPRRRRRDGGRIRARRVLDGR
jgi:class 3 adenylate cyclase